MTEATAFKPKKSVALSGTAAGNTAICTVGRTGNDLHYRGYDILDVAEQCEFEEIAYLIVHEKLPTQSELDAYKAKLKSMRDLPAEVKTVLEQLPASAHPMDVMRTGCSALGCQTPEAADHNASAARDIIDRLMACFGSMLVYWYHYSHNGKRIELVTDDDSIGGHFLHLLHGEPPRESWVKAMHVSLILYAEHEFNASAFASRVVCSTLSDIHSSITAAIGALKGPLHGGANERVMEVLQEVGQPEHADAWVRNALANKVKIMGFGHRVYKTGDPRAKYLKAFCAELAADTGNEAMESMADTIESVVTGEKGLPPNVDWPSARLYYYMGLPIELYTPLFVVSRVTGWSAHVIEQLEHNRIIRPRSNYTGESKRAVVPLSQRA